ncbi:MAG TPA: glycosyltransferase family 1 protein [Dehalococcoidia bacterium]|nr:glycosyltransferase family 1 protein [Dehalococcoidia bacterium]
MKIAYVSPYDWSVPSGVNNHIFKLANIMRDLGHQVDIIAPASHESAGKTVNILGKPVSLPASGSQARIVINPKQITSIKDILSSSQFDLIHYHEPFMPLLSLMALHYSKKFIPDVVNVGTFHATREKGNLMYFLGNRLLKKYMERLDGKIAVSSSAKDYVSRYFPDSYEIIPNGIDIDTWDDPDLSPIDSLRGDDRVNILYVGRAEKRKGLGVLLDAFSIVNRIRPSARLIVVGPDSERQRKYKKNIISSGLGEDIVWVTNPTNEQLPRYYRSADLFVSPATGNESQGYVLMEAMSAHLPVIASNIVGYSYVVRNEKEGILVPAEDVTELSAAMTRLIDSPILRSRLGENGRVRVAEFDWSHISARIADYYQNLLLKKGDAPISGE